MMGSILKICRGLLLVCVAVLAGMAGAQTNVPASVAVPLYQGADRTQRLIEGAKKEGVLTFYSSMAAKDSARIVAGFEKKYGIKVIAWRAGKQVVVQRVISEARAGRHEVDLILAPSPEMEALHREKLLQPAQSPMQKMLIPAALPTHREWAGMRVNVYVQAYNTQKVSAAELPRTYEQLLDPRWKGRLGIEAKAQEWFYVLLQTMGEEKGLQFFRELVAKNGVAVYSGVAVLVNMVASGEVPLALTVYSFTVEQNKANGAPIELLALSPSVAHTDGIGISSMSTHPNAAMLLYDYLLSDGQKMIEASHGLTTNVRDEAHLKQFNPTFIDPALLLDNQEKWRKMYDDTMQGKIAIDK
jgi:iron(III) transport system substrate-binding protein